MATTCIDTKAVNRSGSSQESRVLKALLPASAKVDDRDYADLILFAKKYAAYLNYFNQNNIVDGDWQSLMSMDTSVTLASIAKTDVTRYNQFVKIIYNNILDATDEAARKKHFKNIFDLIYSITLEVDQYHRQLPQDLPFHEYYSSTIQARLAEPFQRLTGYYADFVAAGYIDVASTFLPADVPLAITLSQNFSSALLTDVWDVAILTIDLTVPDPADVSSSIYHIITHNIFNAQLEAYIKALANLVTQSLSSLEETLTNFPGHTPHYTLYLSFIQLFRKAQDHLNSFSERHLDFYYKDVLGLKTKDTTPDSVHVLIELQKGIDQHLLKAGTLFKGGKDIEGKEINYAATKDSIINKAAVIALQSSFLLKKGDVETLYTSTIANSEDGQGAKLLSPNKEWLAFGDQKKGVEADLGFAIASHYLYLNEGARKITLALYFNEPSSIPVSKLSAAFIIELTGKKDWYEVANYSVTSSGKIISFTISLEGDAPPILGYSEKLHKSNYDTVFPVIRFKIRTGLGKSNPYAQLKKLTLTRIKLDVAVDGVKDVIVQNDDGSLDASKPFMPFGSAPKIGSSFIVGSKEIFQKRLTSLKLVIDWDNVPDAMVDQLDEALHEYERTLNYIDMKRKFHTVKVSALQKGQWKELDSKRGLFIEDNLYKDIYDWTRPVQKYAGKLSVSDLEHAVISVSSSTIQPIDPTYERNELFGATSVNGFIRLDLNYPDFGHATYPDALRKAALDVTVSVNNSDPANVTMKVTPSSSIPKEPYTPLVKSFSINYTASTEISFTNPAGANFEGKEGKFYHLQPFGFSELNCKRLTGSVRLLPFYDEEGELYIGLTEVVPGSQVQLLFQLADGTSNPLKDMQALTWRYLSKDNWKEFDDAHKVVDETNNLTQSGIVTISFPLDITKENSSFNPNLYWIKLVAPENTDAVCKLIEIKAQAIKLMLVEEKERGIYFKDLLPPSAISKLLIGDAAIKKITQPYGSFGGRVKESSQHFYTRASERLRHRQRAITAWDYEKLVLEEFKEVYKAKCVQHAGFIPTLNPAVKKYTETVPGHVTVVTIPDLRQHQFKNPLRPYTSIGLLTSINSYLKKLTSPFVKLHVVNPKFEELQFEFNVVFTVNEETFYKKQLSWDIEQFLCPWAYSLQNEIEFGGRLAKSVVLNFIEERPYVDYVTCFKMHHIVERGKEEYRDIEEASATTGISILVSYFNEETNIKHLINEKQACPC